MSWIIVTPPTATEPITAAEAKLFCRIDGDSAEEDAYLGDLISAARRMVETHTHKLLQTQTWATTRLYWPREPYITLPTAPVSAIVSLTYTTADGSQVMAPESYVLESHDYRLPVLRLAGDTAWPDAALVYPGLRVTFDCGYTQPPEELLEAMRSLITYWYDNREAALASTQYKAEVAELPLRYRELIAGHTLRLI